MSENKKEGFTFSDKIKNSKPAFNPFSKRVASKIGANGKPKKTLFERTRRDAPFFIAALAALLLLPFLYKYSGSVEEDTFVRPASVDEDYIPERFDYDPGIGADQVEQLSGRDPMCLIAGACRDTSTTTEESVARYAPLDRDGLDNNYASRSSSRTTTTSTIRRQAPAATRAAFQRTPTKIKELRGASLSARGGGGIGSRFGGANLRAAAKDNSAGGPRNGTKPVSLQPLRAAGSPTRSYFGQGSAAQARASRDAMGKADATQALQDAMFAPVESRRLGGLADGIFASGGGAGKWDRTMDLKSLTPWWWDMMKDQEMKKWEWKYFLWRKNLVEPLIAKLAEMLGTFGFNLGCCILTGQDDCSIDQFFGKSASEGSPGGCKFYKKDPAISYDQYDGRWGKLSASQFKNACKTRPEGGSAPAHEWSDGTKASGKLGFIGVRRFCLGGAAGKAMLETKLQDSYGCEQLNTDNHMFKLLATGDAEKWHKYVAVVVKNYVPFAEDNRYLCVGNPELAHRNEQGKNADAVSGAGSTEVQSTTTDRYTDKTRDNSATYNNHNYRAENIDRDSVPGSCVVYIAASDRLDWASFKQQMVKRLVEYYNDKGQDIKARKANGKDDTAFAEAAFDKLRLSFVEGYAMKAQMQHKLFGTSTGLPQEKYMPMLYADFDDAFIRSEHQWWKLGANTSQGKLRNFASDSTIAIGGEQTIMRAGATNGTATAASTYCVFEDFNIKALPIDTVSNVLGDLTFDKTAYPGGRGLTVSVSVKDKDGKELYTQENVPQVSGSCAANSCRYGVDLSQNTGVAQAAEYITVTWKATNTDNKTSESTTIYSGEVAPVQLESAEEVTESSDSAQGAGSSSLAAAAGSGNDADIAEVSLEKDVSQIPSGLNYADANAASMQWASCQALDTEVNGHKIGNIKLFAIDEDTRNVLKQAKAAFDKANEGVAELKDYSDTDEVSVAMLLHAMTILNAAGTTGIPLNAVCMLGKTIGAASVDPHVRDTGYNNMFGTFAAYMGNDSSYFPAAWMKKQDLTVPDKRFLGCNLPKGVRPNEPLKMFHYGRYNWNGKDMGDLAGHGPNGRGLYEQQLQLGRWKDFPLQPIADAVKFEPYKTWDSAKWGKYQNNMSIDQKNRKKYHDAFKKVFATKGSCGLKGTMPYAKVKQYIDALCQPDALSAKPSAGWSCDSSVYRADENAYPAL